ncbi:hypothetical protein H4217_004760 [Coemansia sp. RSA 1939]|nr:hypothetical protein H4217_004760 [Coemansia sp. RSA 1939]KAJ2610128.1 hypothetical protein EV177_004124 [Coemansia sp. RSA 1804]
MSADIDWFGYYLHPETLQRDFDLQSSTQPWARVPSERHACGVKLLRGLFGTGNFREYIISAYPSLADTQGSQRGEYRGPTPPSTPLAPVDSGSGRPDDLNTVGRMGQCARFTIDSETGLPAESLATVIRGSGLPELTAKQRRLLVVARQLSLLVGFAVEDIEASIHATVRFVYYLYLLEGSGNEPCTAENRLQYRRWAVRSAYREEEIGISLDVPRGTGIDVNSSELKRYVEASGENDEDRNDDGLDKDMRFRVAYDLARVYLAQQRVDGALEMFRLCQTLDPTRCRPDRFGLTAGRAKVSVDEYADACTTIVAGSADNHTAGSGSGERGRQAKGDAGTPVGEFGTMSISPPPQFRGAWSSPLASLVADNRHDDAIKQCLVDAISCTDKGFAWMALVHPLVLDYCLHLSGDEVKRTRAMVEQCAAEWIGERKESRKLSSEQVRVLEARASSFALLLLGKPPGNGVVGIEWAPADLDNSGDRQTIAEDQLRGHGTLSLDMTKTPLATVSVSYCYLSGLRLLEREDFVGAQKWFEHGTALMAENAAVDPAAESASSSLTPAPSATPLPGTQQIPMMAHNAEKDKALRKSLGAQLGVHAKLAAVLGRLNAGADADSLAGEIDQVLAAQTPIRFEFLEHLVLVCLRRDSKTAFTRLVSTIATNQKLYQQLPEIHIALLQVASLLIVVRDTLLAGHVDVASIVDDSLGDDRTRNLEENEEEDSLVPTDPSPPPPPAAADVLPAEVLDKLRKSVADISTLLLKIPLGTKTGIPGNVGAVVGCVQQTGSQTENEIERFCRLWGDPTYLVLFGALLTEMLRDTAAKGPVVGPSVLCRAVTQIVYINAEQNGQASDATQGGTRSIVDDILNTKSEEGRRNTKHMQGIASTVIKCAAHAAPGTKSVWLYFAAIASGMQMEEQAISMFVEYIALHTRGFAPAELERSVRQPWFQTRIPRIVGSLAGMGLSGAAAALHQCAADVAYDAAIPLLVQAFEKREIDQQVAGFFWDPNLIEYAQYLACQPKAVSVRFAVPSVELTQSRPLIMSALFTWLASRLSLKA